MHHKLRNTFNKWRPPSQRLHIEQQYKSNAWTKHSQPFIMLKPLHKTSPRHKRITPWFSTMLFYTQSRKPRQPRA
jgi:hypothetical protein